MKYLTGWALYLAFTAPALIAPALIAPALIAPALIVVTLPAKAADLTVTMNKATPTGPGDAIGTIRIATAQAGATLKLDLHGLPPGPHGFHVHENGTCGPTTANGNAVPAGAAGGHLDPDHTGKHEGPAGQGHKGDLPLLEAAADGSATQILTAPHIKDLDSLHKHAIVIHANGDNYSDTPAPLGGGGGRFACGVIE